MDLFSQLFFAVVISSVAGSLLLFIWWLLRKVFMAVTPKLINVTLRIICIFYMLPLGYVAIFITENKWLKGYGPTWKLFFARTKWLTLLIQKIAIVWFLIACWFVFLRIMQNLTWCRKLKDNIPIEDELASDVFCRVCQKMGISQNAVSLQRNPLMVSPVIIKVRHPQIILPEHEYTEEELELIFYHELSHYKHHDLNWKVAVVILTAIQGFNPVVYRLLSIISFWSECMADVSALETSGNIHNARPYFEKIENLLPEIEVEKKDKYLFASLYRDNKVMVKRVEFVRCYQHAHICSRQVAAVVCMCFVLASILTSNAVGLLMAKLHKFVYKATADYIVMREDGVSEYFLKEKECALDGQEMGLLPIRKSKDNGRILYFMECLMEPGNCQITRSFPVKEGQDVCASVLVKLCMTDYWVGIIDEKGNARYVVGNSRATSHNFLIEKTGRYRVFVQNKGVGKSVSDFSLSFYIE